MGAFLGRAKQAAEASYNVQVFNLDQDLKFEESLRQQYAQMEAAGEMKREQQTIRAQQVTGGYAPGGYNATFFYSMNQFFSAILKWMIMLAILSIIIGIIVKSTLVLCVAVFFLLFSVVYIFYTQGPAGGSYYFSTTPIFVSLAVGGISAGIMAAFANRIFAAIHGPDTAAPATNEDTRRNF